jgi:hypothetical protein
LFAITFCAFLLGNPASAQRATRIKFKSGTVNSVVSGYLSRYKDSKIFLLKVRGGQTIKTEQVGRNYITIFVKSPSDEDAGDSDASCNNRREITPTEAGDYKITVVQCRKADEWHGSFRFRVTVR